MTLLEKLIAYQETQSYAFHMPGHKRQEELGITRFPNPFAVDITEIEGFDNLHHPEGFLKKSMEHAAAVYHADKTYYLVNGSTAGILSSLSALLPLGSRILMGRNSHKAAYHAVFLKQLRPVYVYPKCIGDYQIQGGISPEDIERTLQEQAAEGADKIQAVYITSPTYEGIVSDVETIASVVHNYNIPLIVDEAHGAHFSFGENGMFPRSALKCGADVVIQSVHKTLPSLTQTALLHVKSRFVDTEKLEQYLQIYQSSSPSYVLMSSIENCVLYMEVEGRRRLSTFGGKVRRWAESCTGLKHLKLMTDDVIGNYCVQDRDCTKIVVSVKNTALTGRELSCILREQYQLESEMSCQEYVLFMTSLMDSDEGLERLKNALYQVDALLSGERGKSHQDSFLTWVDRPVQIKELAAAMDAEIEHIGFLEAAGRVSGGFITVYPPGIPALVPGELITEESVLLMKNNRELGLTVEGITEDGRIRVLKDE